MTSTVPAWDPSAFRARVQAALDVFLDEQAERLAPLGADAARLLGRGARVGVGRQALPGGLLLLGLPRRRGHAPTTPTTRWCGPARRWSCSTPARWCTTTTWTPPTPGAAGRPPTAASPTSTARDGWRGDPEQYGASAAILLGDLLLSWSDELLRRCGLPLDRVAPALDVFDRCRSR